MRRFFRPSDSNSDPAAKRVRNEEASTIDLTTTDEIQPRHLAVEPQSQLSLNPLTPYYLTIVPGIDPHFNRNCLGIDDLFHQEAENNPCLSVFIMNYIVDLYWIVSHCPWMLDVELLCLHGSSGGATSQPIHNDKWIIGKVDMHAEQFGTHHSKIGILFYAHGVRAIITTANFDAEDFEYRTQGVWIQDFPLKSGSEVGGEGRVEREDEGACEFEDYLCEYLNDIETTSNRANQKKLEYLQRLRLYDYSSAEVVLIASKPGRHRDHARHKWGIGRLYHQLHQAGLLRIDDFTNHEEDRLVMQFSSVGSMGKDAKLVDEYARWMAPDLSPRQVDIVWPTVECVRNSLQGYVAGGSLPCAYKNMFNGTDGKSMQLSSVQAGFRSKLRVWDGSPTGRALATPHMKCYFRYKQRNGGDKELTWFLLTSTNLSQAAWGVYQSNHSQLYIKSYEIGVLFIGSKMKLKCERTFSCTPSHPILGLVSTSAAGGSTAAVSEAPVRMTIAGSTHSSSGSVEFSVPFVVPAVSYSEERGDQPWVWDRNFLQPADRHGQQRRVIQ